MRYLSEAPGSGRRRTCRHAAGAILPRTRRRSRIGGANGRVRVGRNGGDASPTQVVLTGGAKGGVEGRPSPTGFTVTSPAAASTEAGAVRRNAGVAISTDRARHAGRLKAIRSTL